MLLHLFSLVLAAVSGPVAVAQPLPQQPRIGVLYQGRDVWLQGASGESSAVSDDRDRYAAFLSGLRELGYVQGRNIIVETRAANGKLELLPVLAAELVSLKVAAIVVSGWTAIDPAVTVTKTIPIIIIYPGGNRLTRGSFNSQPMLGGNVTGLVGSVGHGKRIELLKEAIPSVTRLAVLDPVQNGNQRGGLQRLAKTQRVQLEFVNVSRFEDFPAAFAKIASMNPDALITFRQFLTISRRKQIADFALKEKLPSMFEGREFAQAGGLLSYSSNNRAAWRRAASCVDKILKGANPANLPVETPPLELVINLATAKKLGITITPELLLEADEVIQ